MSSARFELSRVCRVALPAGLGLVGLLLASCGKDEGGQQAAAPKGQVIAHVGKDDVTIQELENEFRWTLVPPDKRDDALKAEQIREHGYKSA